MSLWWLAQDHLLNKGFVDLVRYDSKHLTGPISTEPPAVPPSEVVHAAADVLLAKGYLKVAASTSGVKAGIYVNSSSAPGLALTMARARSYNAAIAGRAPSVGTTAEYRATYFSLHLVADANGALVCSCKGFWTSKVLINLSLIILI